MSDEVDDTREVLRGFVDALEAAGVPYMLTGSFASGYYGNGRSTQDVDFVIMPTADQLRALVASFPAPTFYVDLAAAMEALRERGQFNVIDRINAYKADFIIQKPHHFNQEEFGRRVPAIIHGVPLMVASAEDVILSKLQWSKLGGSLRQIEDAAGILELRKDSLDRAYIESWVERLGLDDRWRASLEAARLDL